MKEPDRDNLDKNVLDLAKSLAAIIVPSEAEFFDEILATVGIETRRVDDRALGHGLSIEELASVSTALVVICKPVIQFIWDNSKDSAQGIVTDAAKTTRLLFAKKVSQWTESKEAIDGLIHCSPKQIDEIANQARKDALSAGLEDDVARKVESILRDKLRPTS